MNAILINKFGGPENCEYTSGLPIPEPNENQVSRDEFSDYYHLGMRILINNLFYF